MTAELRKAVEELYRAFLAYQMPEHVDMSPYRDPEKAIGAMNRKPLRELTAPDLDYYAAAALTTVGDEELLKYALPRLLELVTEDEFLTDSEIVLGKLAYGDGGWCTWPHQEQQAVRAFLMAWWSDSLGQSGYRADRAYGVLASIALAEDDLLPYLSCWDTHPALSATDQVASLFAYMWDEEDNVVRHNPFLRERPAQAEQIRSWLFRQTTLQRLERHQGTALRRGLDDERHADYRVSIDVLSSLFLKGTS